jgi:hypothetical protein
VQEFNGDRGKVVEGWTAFRLAKLTRYLAYALLVVTVLSGVCGILLWGNQSSARSDFIAWIACFVWLPLVVVGSVLSTVTRRRMSMEVRSGYTTIGSRYPEVDQIHPVSGALIRRAGEPLLSKAAFDAALRDPRNHNNEQLR